MKRTRVFKAQFSSSIIFYHVYTMRPFSDNGPPSLLNELENRSHVIGGVDCRFDTSATSLCSRKRYLPSWSSSSTVSRSEKMDSHRKWAATVESRTLSWQSSLTSSVGGGGYIRDTHTFPVALDFPYHHLSSPFDATFLLVLLSNTDW